MNRACVVALCLCFHSTQSDANEWRRFLGPAGTGRVESASIPWDWSSAKNLEWKTPLPGKGSSSPIVTSHRVYLTCYTGYGTDVSDPGDPAKLTRHVLAFDRESGEELWRFSVKSSAPEDPYRGFITQHGYASSTPVSDGENVYALLGKSGLFAIDTKGKEIWRTSLGVESDPAKWGDATSPILVGEILVVDAGVLGNQFVGVNKRTGEIVWSLQDKGFTNCWATPKPVEVDGRKQVLVHVPNKVMAIDPIQGSIIWSAASPIDDAACGSIVAENGVAMLMGSRAGRALALAYAGPNRGQAVWQKPIRSGIATPVIVGDQMYWSTGGIFYAADVKTGEYIYKQRLPRFDGPSGGFPNADYSSPIAVAGNIIQLTRNGESYVIEAGEEFNLIAHNPPFEGDESAFSATPAVIEGQLFIRSEQFLYCIANDND